MNELIFFEDNLTGKKFKPNLNFEFTVAVPQCEQEEFGLLIEHDGLHHDVNMNALILNMPLQGLSQGTQPIISQNYGAGEINRANEASKKLIIFSLIFSFIFVLILNIFPQVFVRIFNQNETLISVARKLIRIMFIGMAFMGIQIGCQNSFLALGKSKISLILALLRKIILLIPLTFILPLFIQIKGIFIAESVADVLAILVTLICYLCLFKKYLKLPINTNKK